ncbi:MAG TPA: septal ring lytic transglycosylase RlpA family protein [Candidatus Tectomicrobia bacterium]
MPYTRKVIMGAGWSLMLALMGTSIQADPWYREQGLASYYGKGFHGRTAADGDRFSQHEMTAAHRQLPLGTKVMVENRTTGEQVEVKITDRGPYADPKRRIIDLSKAAAHSIGLVEPGVGPVRVVVTEETATKRKSPQESLVYEVQVGAFEHEDHAQAVLEQVQGWFPKAYMTPRQGPEGPYYRVRIGPFTDKDAAQRIARGLTRGGHRVFLDEVPETALPPEAPPPSQSTK